MAIFSTFLTVLLEVAAYLAIGSVSWFISGLGLLMIVRRKYGRLYADYVVWHYIVSVGTEVMSHPTKAVAWMLFAWVYSLPIAIWEAKVSIEDGIEACLNGGES